MGKRTTRKAPQSYTLFQGQGGAAAHFPTAPRPRAPSAERPNWEFGCLLALGRRLVATSQVI